MKKLYRKFSARDSRREYMREYMRSRRASGNLIQTLQDKKDSLVYRLRKATDNSKRLELVERISKVESDMASLYRIKNRYSK